MHYVHNFHMSFLFAIIYIRNVRYGSLEYLTD